MLWHLQVQALQHGMAKVAYTFFFVVLPLFRLCLEPKHKMEGEVTMVSRCIDTQGTVQEQGLEEISTQLTALMNCRKALPRKKHSPMDRQGGAKSKGIFSSLFFLSNRPKRIEPSKADRVGGYLTRN